MNSVFSWKRTFESVFMARSSPPGLCDVNKLAGNLFPERSAHIPPTDLSVEWGIIRDVRKHISILLEQPSAKVYCMIFQNCFYNLSLFCLSHFKFKSLCGWIACDVPPWFPFSAQAAPAGHFPHCNASNKWFCGTGRKFQTKTIAIRATMQDLQDVWIVAFEQKVPDMTTVWREPEISSPGVFLFPAIFFRNCLRFYTKSHRT